MPELPEVEVVRRGLQRWITDRTIADIHVHHPRAVRRHTAGALDLAARLRGRRIEAVSRRGKYLWLVLDGRDAALLAHLGMSGQLLVQETDAPQETHLRVVVDFSDGGRHLRFVDQRTFGGMALDDLVPDGAGGVIPSTVAHIARDPLDPHFDDDAFLTRLRLRRSGIKRALLDQALMSGVGNIYADESLWRARLHPERDCDVIPRVAVRGLLGHVRDVMTQALAQGGTSFDSLYVNVNGESGYFDRSLDAYGRAGHPCRRCGRLLVREAFMNRSSVRCPNCQRVPRSRVPRSRVPRSGGPRSGGPRAQGAGRLDGTG
jgi:formamidopyrimidine-DNA glycosylase